VSEWGVVRFHTVVFVLTSAAACGSGPSGPKSAPAEPPKAFVPVDAAPPDAPSPPKLVCDDGTAATQGPAPEPTWLCVRPDGTRHGPFVSLFPDGTIAIEGRYQDNLLDGPWQRHDASGPVIERGPYSAGKKSGHWVQLTTGGAILGEYDLIAGTGIERRWLDDGTRYSELSWKAGVRHGPSKIFAPDGSLMETAKFLHGKLEGPHVVGTSRTVRIDEKFLAGFRHGPRTIWQFGLKVAEETYDRRGRLDGAYVLWRSTKVPRVKGQFSHGKRTGAWVWTDRDNNKEREGSYLDGKRDGWWIEWVENKVVFTGSYVAGKPDGELTYWDRNGNELGKFAMKNGTGVMLTFHANHKPSSRQRLIKGVEDGFYQELTNRGKVVVEGSYRNGVKHGAWKELTPDGIVVLEQGWKRGKLDGIVKKYVDGKLSVESTYVDGKAEGSYVETRNGKPAVTGQFSDDRKSGTWTHYNRDGAVILTATYQAGVLDGPWRQLVDGVALEGQMASGRRTGTWTRTDKAGVVRKLVFGLP
jgi:uncharacterized protein